MSLLEAGLYRFCLLFVMIGGLSRQEQEVTSSPAKSTQPRRRSDTANQRGVRELLGARIAYAKFLTVYFDKIDRQTIHVSAIGEDRQTLDVFSVLIGKFVGSKSHNLVSAREVIESSDSVALLKKCRFRKVVVRGTDYTETYVIP